MRAHIRIALVLLAACGDDGPTNTIDVTPDAPTPDTLEPEPHVVTVEQFGSIPIFIMYREGPGAWQVPDATSDGYTLRVREAYELVTVCGDASLGFDVGFEASTYEESNGRTIVPCYMPTDPLPQTFAVTGTMVQPGEVLMGYAEAKSTTANWSFALQLPQGSYPLIAVSSDRMEIRRNQNVNGATTLPAIDVVADGEQMPSTTVMAAGTQRDETVSTRIGIRIGSGGFRILDATPGNVVRVAPSTLLEPGDRQYVWLDAVAGTSFRSGFAQYQRGDTLAFMLPPRVSGVQFGTTSASWSSPLPAGQVSLYMYAGPTSWHGTMTPGLAASRTTLALDTADIQGWKAEWNLGAVEYREFSVHDDDGSVSLTTGVSEVLLMSRAPRRGELPRSRALRYEMRAAAAK